MTKKDRLDAANTLLLTISNCGRRFFFDSRYNSVSQFKFGSNMGYDHNRLYFHDKSSNKLLPCSHYTSNNWKVNFTQGGTLFAMIKDLEPRCRAKSSAPNRNPALHSLYWRIYGPKAEAGNVPDTKDLQR